MSDRPISSTTRSLLVNMPWLLWSVAMVNLTLTHRLSIWFRAEVFSLCLICLGFLWGVAAFAAIAKYGAGGILKPALAGIGLNGILLAIAIPNFIHGRNEALQLRAVTMAPTIAQTGNPGDTWQEYDLAGVQIVSPVTLSKKDASEPASSQPVEFYMGQLLPSGFTVTLSRRELGANEDYALEDIASAAADTVRQRFPEGFESSSIEVQVDGIPARKLIMGFISHGTPVQQTTMMFVKQPYLWMVKVGGIKDLPGFNEDTDRILNSIKLVPVQTAASLAR